MTNATNNPVNLSLQMKHAPGVTTTCKQTILFSYNTQSDTCMHACTHIDARMHAYMYTRRRKDAYMYTRRRKDACPQTTPAISGRVREDSRVFMHMHVHVYTQLHMHACTHYVSYIMYSLNAVYTCQCIQHNCALSNIVFGIFPGYGNSFSTFHCDQNRSLPPFTNKPTLIFRQ